MEITNTQAAMEKGRGTRKDNFIGLVNEAVLFIFVLIMVFLLLD